MNDPRPATPPFGPSLDHLQYLKIGLGQYWGWTVRESKDLGGRLHERDRLGARTSAIGSAIAKRFHDRVSAGTQRRRGWGYRISIRIRFPPDLRQLLQTALPTGDRFPDWRSGKQSELHEWLDLPRTGILFDVEHNSFWLHEWGERPANLTDALDLASEQVRAAPTLIPMYAHRMMPDEPELPGNPVFSVHQTDIVYYGFDLLDYLRHEFELSERDPWPDEVRAIRFWDLGRFAEES